MTRAKKIGEVVNQVAGWYSRRVWWAEEAELVQEGWRAALEASADVPDEHVGGFVRQVVSRHLSRWCWSQSSPVSVSGHRAGRALLAGKLRADVSETMAAHGRHPEAELIAAESRRMLPALRASLEQELRRAAKADSAAEEAAVTVLLKASTPAKEAQALGVPVKKIYRALGKMKKLASADAVVRGVAVMIKDRSEEE